MRKILLTLISFVALSALVACGGGSSNNNAITIPPVPSGGNNAGFSNSSLTGNFVFAVNGITQNNAFATTGIFTADGRGNITSGVRDTVNDGGSQALNESISGNYSINQDGRGQVVLNGGSGQVIYRFVLQTASAPSPVVGKLFQNGTTLGNGVQIDAVGRIEAQAGAPSSVAGAYIVRLDGEDGGNNSYGAVGNLNLSAGGSTGMIDENDNGTFNGLLAASVSYSFTGNGRGILSYVTPGSTAATPAPQGNHNFVAYFVTPNHLELISVDPRFFLHGYADLQTSFSASASAFATSAPNQVFSLSGFDLTGTRVETGRLTLDTDGSLSNAIEDINDASNVFSGVSLTATSSYLVGANGRWTANLANTPTAGSTTGLVGWQVSPEQSSILTTNPNVLETGTMRGQTLGLTNANVIGNYAEALSGTNTSAQSNAELTGNLNADGAGNLSGTYDSQADNFGLNLDVGTTGNYTVDPTLGRSTNGNINGIPVVIYTVDKNTIDFISAQQFSVYQGMIVSQTP